MPDRDVIRCLPDHYCSFYFLLLWYEVLFPNMALMTFTSMGGSLIATMSNKILEVTGGYTTTFMMLLALSAVALILNVFIRRP